MRLVVWTLACVAGLCSIASAASVATRNGLELDFNDADASISGISFDHQTRVPLNGQPGGFYVADMIGDKLLGKMSYKSQAFAGTRVAATATQSRAGVVVEGSVNDLWMRARIEDCGEYLSVSGDLVNLRPAQDRAVILYFRLPVDATGGKWGKNLGDEQTIAASDERYINPSYFHQGYRPAMSRLPIATLSAGDWGLSLAQPMNSPRFFRLTYQKPYGLQIEYEFGLSAATWKFRNRAPFQFLLYRHDPHWGLRSAFETYYRLFPEQFHKRTIDGMWIDNWEGKRKRLGDASDFGIVYNETGGWADEQQRTHDVLSMAYIEPWCDHIEATPDQIEQMAQDTPENKKEARFGRGADLRTNALQLLNSVAYGRDGKILDPRTAAEGGFYVESKPDFTCLRYLTNPDPELPTPFGGMNRAQKITKYDLYTTWGRTTNQPQYEKDGIYYDSIGGSWSGMHLQNFRRDHMPYVDVPLTFDHKTGKVSITHGFSAIKFLRYCTTQAHQEGRPTMGNSGAGDFLPFTAPWLDMGGAGENYKYQPDFSDLREMRAMMRDKPLSFLNNAELKDPAKAEASIDALLLYASYPGAANVDQMVAQRHLYRAYIPIYNALGEAGWEPIPFAQASGAPNAKGLTPWCERFGNSQSGYFFTVRNPGAAGDVTLSLDLPRLGITKASFTAVCGCQIKSSSAGQLVLLMPAEWTGVIAVNRDAAAALAKRCQEEVSLFHAEPAK